MITTASIRDIHPDDYDEVWAIVRSANKLHANVKHVPVLSPSKELFWHYLDLAKTGRWNIGTFESDYRPVFMKEMESPEAVAMLDHLVDLDRAGKNIALVCFCTDKNLCHRKLIAELLTQRGCKTVHFK